MQVLGTDELYNYLSKYGIELDPQLEGLVGRHARRPWNKFTNPENAHLVTPEGMDFLDNLLKYDHQVRHATTAAAAAAAQCQAATAAAVLLLLLWLSTCCCSCSVAFGLAAVLTLS